MGEHAYANDHGHDAGHSAGHGHDHGHPNSHYVKIWGVLVVLLAISVAGPELGIPIVTLITAFGIAVIKALIVMKYFMHVNVEKPMIWYMLGTSVVFLIMFFAGVSPDVMNHTGSRWENVAAQQTVERLMAEGAAAAEHHGEHGEDHAAPAEGGHGGGH